MDFGGKVSAAVQSALGSDFTIGVVAALVLAFIGWLIRPVRDWAVRSWQKIVDIWGAESRLRKALNALEGDGVWLSKPISSPQNYNIRMRGSIPIITVANLKGGVGKTTIAANLAAYYSLGQRERVLLIDLDFQGSLSSMLVPKAHLVPVGGRSKAAVLISDGIDAGHLLNMVSQVDRMEQARAVTAYYDLARAENRTMVRWLLGEAKQDVRYMIADLLLDDRVQHAFDKIIIDAPPRMTTGAIQAFCASTHVLIPTVLDSLSGDAVASFVIELENLREADVCPNLKVLGVVGSMVASNIGRKLEDDPDADPPLTIAERQGIASVKTQLERVQREKRLAAPPATMLPPETYVQKLAIIANQAGEHVVYTTGNDAVKEMFERLGREIQLRLVEK